MTNIAFPTKETHGEIKAGDVFKFDGTKFVRHDERIDSWRDALQQLELTYFAEYGGNSVSLEDAIRRSPGEDQCENELIESIKNIRAIIAEIEND